MKAALFVYFSLAMLVVNAIPVRIARTEADTDASYTQKWYRRDEVDSEVPYANGEGGRWWARAEPSDVDSEVPYANGEGGSWWARGE